MPNKSDATSLWNPGTKLALFAFVGLMVGLMVGLKIIDTLVQEGGQLSLSWRWALIAGLGGGVYATVAKAYQLGISDERNRTTET